jgi:hypothetical protein
MTTSPLVAGRAAAKDPADKRAGGNSIDTGQSVAINTALRKLGMEQGMALIGVLKSLNFDHVQGKDRADLKRRLQEHKKELEKAVKHVDRHLKTLGGAKKKRKAGKKKV